MATCFTYFFVINNAFQYLSNVKWCRLIRATLYTNTVKCCAILHTGCKAYYRSPWIRTCVQIVAVSAVDFNKNSMLLGQREPTQKSRMRLMDLMAARSVDGLTPTGPLDRHGRQRVIRPTPMDHHSVPRTIVYPAASFQRRGQVSWRRRGGGVVSGKSRRLQLWRPAIVVVDDRHRRMRNGIGWWRHFRRLSTQQQHYSYTVNTAAWWFLRVKNFKRPVHTTDCKV